MARQTITIALITAAALLAGCVDREGATQPASGLFGTLLVPAGGTSRRLPAGNYPAAFSQARAIMGQYFAISSVDQDNGLIKCLPKRLDNAPSDRLIGGSPTRQVATMKIVRRSSGRIDAICSVQLQRQSSAILRQQSLLDETYDSVPDQTPGEVEAATTPDQNDAWETYRSDQALENKILNDLEQVLRAGGA